MRIFISLLIIFSLTACGESGPEAETPSLLRLTYIDAEVRHFYDRQSGLDSTVPNALILVYRTVEDRTDSVRPLKSVVTDSTGSIQFYYSVKLGQTDYTHYVKVVHPELGIKLYDINTPPEKTTPLNISY